MAENIFSVLLKYSFLVVFITSFVVIINAIISAKALGGELGEGLKKIAAGTIFHIILILTFLALEQNNRGLLTGEQVKLFFLFTGVSGSTFLILGYLQIYRVSKRFKLF